MTTESLVPGILIGAGLVVLVIGAFLWGFQKGIEITKKECAQHQVEEGK